MGESCICLFFLEKKGKMLKMPMPDSNFQLPTRNAEGAPGRLPKVPEPNVQAEL
jgi:hypothetical protein